MTRPLKQNGIATALLDALADHRARCEQTCARKIRYASDHVARAVGTEQMAGGAPQLFIYQCKVCRGWHLTKQEAAPYWAADYYEKNK